MELLLKFALFYLLCSGALTCFEEKPLEPWLQEYLALNKTCQNTLFPTPPCCGAPFQQMQARIINGQVTGLNELPWIVYIDMRFKTKDKLLAATCHGSLINPLWILSAAHCFRITSGFQHIEAVHIGDWNIHTNPDCLNGYCAPDVIKVLVAKIITHSVQDLALVRLKSAVEYSNFVRPICLPLTPLRPQCYENKETIIAGWGRTDVNIQRPSALKMKTTLTVLRKARCSVFTKHPYEICGANYELSSACNGDSGTPLNFELPNGSYYQLGVLSRGSKMCYSFLAPNIFTRVDIKWIRNNINAYENDIV